MANWLLQSPLVLTYLLLGFWMVAFRLFSRFWSRTSQGQEWREFRARLDPGIRRRAIGLQWLFLIVFGTAIMLAAIRLRHLFHPGDDETSPLATALMVASSYIVALFPAQYLTNLIWSLTPSMRAASRAAAVGLNAVSFRSAAIIGAIQAIVLIPICAAQIYWGAVIS